MRVLLTGFGPYPGAPSNPSGDLAPALASEAARRWPSCAFVWAVLPTEWRAAIGSVDMVLDRHRPDVCVHFGLSERARGFAVESVAYNQRARRPDAAGELPVVPHVVAGGPARLAGGAHVHRIVRRLAQRGIPVAHSSDAGRYLCNALYYHVLLRTAREGVRRQVTFVHMPPAEEPQPDSGKIVTVMRPELAFHGGIAILEAALEETAHAMA